jgi:hypothetical protein
MILLRRCDHALQAAHFANLLRAAGIRCEVRNTALSGAIGDIPFLECAPQLWVDHALDATRAAEILANAQRAADGPHWRCACGEWLEPQFGSCWSCGAARPPA